MKREKKKKEKFVDDGRVIAPMDNEYITGYKSKEHREKRRELQEANLSRKERWAIYKAMLGNVMPVFLTFMLSLVAAILLLYFFWERNGYSRKRLAPLQRRERFLILFRNSLERNGNEEIEDKQRRNDQHYDM